MKPETLKHGDVVQINPEYAQNPAFAGCFMIVTDSTTFGAYGYVQDLGHIRNIGRVAWYRAGWAEIELVGKAAFTLQD